MNKEELIRKIDLTLARVSELSVQPDITVTSQLGKSPYEIVFTITTTDPDIATALRRARYHIPGTIPQSTLTDEQIVFLDAAIKSCKPVIARQMRDVGLDPNGLFHVGECEAVYADDDIVGVVYHTGRHSYSIVPKEITLTPR